MIIIVHNQKISIYGKYSLTILIRLDDMNALRAINLNIGIIGYLSPKTEQSLSLHILDISCPTYQDIQIIYARDTQANKY